MKNKIVWENNEFEISNVHATITTLNGEKVLRVERDLVSLPFDKDKMVSTIDEPTFVKLVDENFENGVIEVKFLSRLLEGAPSFARGFIGLAFRINRENSSYDSIYLRPTNSRCDDQLRKNHTVQYYAYPNYKFDFLRKNFEGEFETYVDIGLDEWITMKIEVIGRKVKLFINDNINPILIINETKGSEKSGSIGLWVDIGTEGYFKDLKIEKK